MRADVHGDRYVVADASMVDLIAQPPMASKQIMWWAVHHLIEMDHFDIDAKRPAARPRSA